VKFAFRAAASAAQMNSDVRDTDSERLTPKRAALPFVGLLQGESDLLFAKLALLHDMTPVSSSKNHAGNSRLERDYLLG
jgi:hypothetical protein